MDKFDISPQQYHGGLDKLWAALEITTVQDEDVFTLAARQLTAAKERIVELEKRLTDLRQAAAIPEAWSHSDAVFAMIGLRCEGDALTEVGKTVKGLRQRVKDAEAVLNIISQLDDTTGAAAVRQIIETFLELKEVQL